MTAAPGPNDTAWADEAVSLLRLHYGRTYDVIVHSGLAEPAADE